MNKDFSGRKKKSKKVSCKRVRVPIVLKMYTCTACEICFLLPDCFNLHRRVLASISVSLSICVYDCCVSLAYQVAGHAEQCTWLRKDGSHTKINRDQIMESVEGSLERLGTDYIDILHLGDWPER